MTTSPIPHILLALSFAAGSAGAAAVSYAVTGQTALQDFNALPSTGTTTLPGTGTTGNQIPLPGEWQRGKSQEWVAVPRQM